MGPGKAVARLASIRIIRSKDILPHHEGIARPIDDLADLDGGFPYVKREESVGAPESVAAVAKRGCRVCIVAVVEIRAQDPLVIGESDENRRLAVAGCLGESLQ